MLAKVGSMLCHLVVNLLDILEVKPKKSNQKPLLNLVKVWKGVHADV